MLEVRTTAKGQPRWSRRVLTTLLRDDSGLHLRLLALIPLAVLQLGILPVLGAGYVIGNVLTVWVVINTVMVRVAHSLPLSLATALLLETHSSAPRGLYLCAYGTLVGALHLVKGLVTWNRHSAWLAVLFAAELWLLVLEHIVVAVPLLDLLTYGGRYLLRISGTCLGGYLLIRYAVIHKLS